MSPRHSSIALGVAAAVLLAGCSQQVGGAGSEGYPSDSIRWVVPYAPGGGTDSTSRVVASCMEKDLGQTVVVENLPGGNAVKGAKEVIASKPDGYTVGLALSTGMTMTPLLEKVGFTKDDIAPVGAFYQFGLVIGASKKSQYRTAPELFAAVRKNPGKVSVGVSGTTGPTAIAFKALEKAYGLDFNIIPLAGAGAVNTALLGGQVDVAGLGADLATKPFVESGDFTVLASLADKRWSQAPAAPTLTELGYGKATFPKVLFLLFGPKQMPAGVVAALESALAACVTADDVGKALGGGDYVPAGVGAEESVRALNDAQALFQRVLEGS